MNLVSGTLPEFFDDWEHQVRNEISRRCCRKMSSSSSSSSSAISESHSSRGAHQSGGDGDDDSSMFGLGSSSPISGDVSMDSLDGDHGRDSQLPLNFQVGSAAATPGTQRNEMSIRWPNKPLQIAPCTPAKRTIDGVLLQSQGQSDAELKQFLQSLDSSELVNFGLRSVAKLNHVLAEKAEWKKQNKTQLQTIRRLRSRVEKLQDKS